MSDGESNQQNPAVAEFVTKESVCALDRRLQNLETMLTNLTQYFLGGQNNNYEQRRRDEVDSLRNFRRHRNQLSKMKIPVKIMRDQPCPKTTKDLGKMTTA
ncbi:hypothetical protein PanWU01x14_288760 [Parasponia andersonii]|uniref:Uncharacterized protein n=1 Tax=Parasponia andersonii TaxID=3476 RepID=A0A2P5AY86_PARAD|nr:hypothetical protein PanWU01x14_288760 [Parasponia andersonii]